MLNDITNGYFFYGDILIIGVSLIYIMIVKATDYKMNTLSRILMRVVFFMIAAGAVNILLHEHIMVTWPKALIYGVYDLYYILLLVMFAYIGAYVSFLSSSDTESLRKELIMNAVINILGIIMILISPLTKWGLYCDENGVWHEAMWNRPYMIFYVVNIIFILLLVVTKKNQFLTQVRYVFAVTEFYCVIIFVLGNIYNRDSLTLITFGIPVLVVTLLFHTNSYNAEDCSLDVEVFARYLKKRHERGQQDVLIAFEFLVDKNFVLPKALGMAIYTFFSTYVKGARIYRVYDGLYVMSVPMEKNPVAMKNVKTMAANELPKYYDNFSLAYKMVAMETPNVSTLDEFTDLYNFFNKGMGPNEVKYVLKDGYEDFNNLNILKKHLLDIEAKGDLNDERVLVYCQPIFNIEKDCFDTAEALMRMNIPEVGMVFPDKFIPLAEEMGVIHKLSLIMLNKVCKKVKELEDNHYKIKRISVNFSVSEINNENFIRDFEKIIDSHNLGYEKIGAELTESSNEANFTTVLDTVNRFKAFGTTVYLDDFGTGYSNFDRILSLKFDVIKFDRSLLLLVQEKKEFKTLVHALARAFYEMGYVILFEGVETEEDEKFCKECYASYLQGYKYARPVPIDEITGYLKIRQ